ncbi:MAG: GNAT family N-acetyltransferase, partial [Beijerinckiaceae bacterium]
MLILRHSALRRPDLVIEGERHVLRPPRPEDHPAWSRLREESRAFLEPWEPVWPADDLTPAAYRARLGRYRRSIADDLAYPFLLFDRASGALLGGLNLTQVRRGAASMASLGYWMGAKHAGQGHMGEAVRLALEAARARLHLRRIEAACLPENAASIRLLTGAGFVREGFAPEYLNIAGAWRDHILFG